MRLIAAALCAAACLGESHPPNTPYGPGAPKPVTPDPGPLARMQGTWALTVTGQAARWQETAAGAIAGGPDPVDPTLRPIADAVRADPAEAARWTAWADEVASTRLHLDGDALTITTRAGETRARVAEITTPDPSTVHAQIDGPWALTLQGPDTLRTHPLSDPNAALHWTRIP